jgi:hypothetical protein
LKEGIVSESSIPEIGAEAMVQPATTTLAEGAAPSDMVLDQAPASAVELTATSAGGAADTVISAVPAELPAEVTPEVVLVADAPAAEAAEAPAVEMAEAAAEPQDSGETLAELAKDGPIEYVAASETVVAEFAAEPAVAEVAAQEAVVAEVQLVESAAPAPEVVEAVADAAPAEVTPVSLDVAAVDASVIAAPAAAPAASEAVAPAKSRGAGRVILTTLIVLIALAIVALAAGVYFGVLPFDLSSFLL